MTYYYISIKITLYCICFNVLLKFGSYEKRSLYISKLFSCKIQPLHRHSQPFARVLRMSRTHPKMKLLNRPSIAFIDYISYRQLIDRRLIVDIPNANTLKNHIQWQVKVWEPLVESVKM